MEKPIINWQMPFIVKVIIYDFEDGKRSVTEIQNELKEKGFEFEVKRIGVGYHVECVCKMKNVSEFVSIIGVV